MKPLFFDKKTICYNINFIVVSQIIAQNKSSVAGTDILLICNQKKHYATHRGRSNLTEDSFFFVTKTVVDSQKVFNDTKYIAALQLDFSFAFRNLCKTNIK